MARKLAGVVFAVSTMHASVVQALGLGDIDMKSSINQPLRAQIAVLNTAELEASQLSVRLAGQEAFDRAGVERGFFLSDLTFTVQFDGKGGGVIKVASEKPVREPFIDFVLEARWPEGHLVREYTLLVDLPEFAEGAVVAAVPPPASTDAARIQPPAPARRAVDSAQADQIVTRRSDTLWEIAARVKPGSVNMQQAMMALLERNPEAFEQRNINRLRKGQVMHFPSDAEYRALTADEAITAVARQNAEWRAGQADAAGSVAAGGGAASSDESYMKLSGSTATEPGVDAAPAGGGGEAVAASAAQQAEVEALRSKITVAEERLDSAERENAEMNDRLGDLEQQIDTLMQLVEMKNRQLADLQGSGAAELAADPSSQGEAGAVGSVAAGAASSDPVGAGVENPAAVVAVAAPALVDQNFVSEPVAPSAEGGVAAPEAQPEALLSLSSPLLWSVVGGIGVVAAAGGLVVHRRRREEAAIEAAEEALVAEEARASLKARAVGATAEAGSVVDADALLANDDNSEPLLALDGSAPADSDAGAAALDPMSQAEVMCAEGQHEQAIDVLRQALASDASSSEIHLQLLGILADLDRKEDYREAFAALERCDQDAAFMARHLVAEKGWLDSGDDESGAGQNSGVAEPTANSAVSALDTGSADAPAADLLADAELDLDLNLDLGELDTSSLELENDSLGDLPGEPELKLDLGSFDAGDGDAPVDLGVDLSLDLVDGIEAQADQGDLAAGAGPQAGAGDLASLLDAEAGLDDEMQGMLDTDAITTKLDLARAYVDMGDVNGARDILEEVLQEGSEGQKGEASELLSAIAS